MLKYSSNAYFASYQDFYHGTLLTKTTMWLPKEINYIRVLFSHDRKQ